MTDWIDNNMKVFGKEMDLEIFKKEIYEVKENILTFRKIIPTREEYSAWEKEKIYPKKLDWEFSVWNLEWDANQFVVKNRENYLLYNFDTPRDPPIPIFITLFKRYQSLNFEIISCEIDEAIRLQMESVQGNLKKIYRILCRKNSTSR